MSKYELDEFLLKKEMLEVVQEYERVLELYEKQEEMLMKLKLENIELEQSIKEKERKIAALNKEVDKMKTTKAYRLSRKYWEWRKKLLVGVKGNGK